MAQRFILHADMDAFYASIEQRDRPELRGLPVIVGANSARGVVAAASYEARKFGVRSAMPGFQARALCPNGVFLPANIARYAEVSEQVHGVFGEFTPDIEPIALDEAFLDITASERLFGGPLELATRLKRLVLERTELTISVGVAPNKLVAKIACTLAKPNGLKMVREEEVRALLDPLPVRRLWGVGPVLGDKLARLGLKTFADIVAYDAKQLARELGERAGELQALAAGIDSRPVISERAAKSIGEENTFETDTLDREKVSAVLTAHADEVARRLRRSGYLGCTVTLKIKLGTSRRRREARVGEGDEPVYPLLTRSKTLREPTDDGALIRQVALDLWDAARIKEPVRLLGVSVSQLSQSERTQLELFTPQKPARALGQALDAIRERFGRDAIGPAVGNLEKVTPSLRKKRGE
ncbi:MAG TPA: DNA polymerase IV [Polyangiaceae bacterium]|jgi:DNA polymerase-4|nr:DNA polymerase IV [Polyangiaceae bacterium]